MVRKSEFDEYAGRYDEMLAEAVKAGGFPPAYFHELKVCEVKRHLAAAGRETGGLRILNYGCGVGRSEPYIRRHFPDAAIFSCDVSAESIALARKNNADLADVHFGVGDGLHVPFVGEFHIALLAGVLHHVSPAERGQVVREVGGRLGPEGLMFVFEHNPLNPLTRRVVRTCPFDEGVSLLSPWYAKRLLAEAGLRPCALRFIIFFPRVLRTLLPLEPYLAWIPLGAQYYVVAGRTPARMISHGHGA